MCILLCYTVSLGTIGLEQIADAAIYYSNLSRNNWGQVNTDIHYRYDDNGSLTEKVTANKDEPNPETNYIEKVIYEYDIRNRLSKVISTVDNIPTTYTYDDDGNRVQRNVNGTTITKYVVDPHNPTGYSQVLEEWTGSATFPSYTYVIGEDCIAQISIASLARYYLCDGQGSVRHHTNSTGDLVGYGTPSCDTFAYDSFGQRVDPITFSTGLFYTGQMWDSKAKMYYLRARWYNPANGRFNATDTYAGNNSDPISLHKYLYCHANPVNNSDPSGMLLSDLIYGKFVHDKIGEDFLSSELTGRFYNVSIKTILNLPFSTSWWLYRRPDLVDRATGEVYEIKAVNSYAIGVAQLGVYLYLLNNNVYCSPLNK